NNERKLGLTNGMVGVVEEITPNAKFRGEQMENILNGDDFDLTMNDLDSFADNMHVDTTKKDEPTDEDEDENERQASHVMKVKFQNVEETTTFQTAGAFNKIAHSYAITCHKSQGGEYPTVVVVCHASDLMMLNREWLYTAITRAQKRVILLTNTRGLMHAVNAQRVKGQTVQEKIQRFIALETDDSATKPNLPEPETRED
ncbi:MAG: ATP-binding domain-containing protein, partial [Thermodesulfovibrionia bacterium]|nr:ATP-binding domain-containing protein [Thermodesulfovibrionia bacterium]